MLLCPNAVGFQNYQLREFAATRASSKFPIHSLQAISSQPLSGSQTCSKFRSRLHMILLRHSESKSSEKSSPFASRLPAPAAGTDGIGMLSVSIRVFKAQI